MTYFKVIPVSTYDKGIFDTMEMIAKETGIKYETILDAAGFGLDGESLDFMLYPPNNYFSIEHLVMIKLNEFLRSCGINIRVSSPWIRRPDYALYNKAKNRRSRLLGWW